MLTEEGQSLVEVIIAATVGTLVVTALTFATIFSIRNANFAKNSAQATKLAQEGIERVRSGRDRNQCINNLTNVQSWNGGNSSCFGTGSIWDYQIKTAGGCENTTAPGSKCYFNIDPQAYSLTNIGFAFVPTTDNPLPSLTETIAGTSFKRALVISDDNSYQTQKTVTVIVQWKDFSGLHESKLKTILRKL